MDLQLADKRALVTGSSSGIGEAIVKALAREGAAVAVHGRRAAEVERVVQAIRAQGGSAVATVGDLTSDESAQRIADRALGAFGGIDILINNAGAAPPGGWFEDGEPEIWKSVYDQNVVSAVRMIQRIVPDMQSRGWGRVINLASVVASVSISQRPYYGATKAANINQAVSLSKALAGTGITVNSVSPGLILTPATEPMIRGLAQENGWGEDWAVIERNIVGSIAPNLAGRLGTADEVANVVVFLASPLAGYINGANLRVDGGANPTVN